MNNIATQSILHLLRTSNLSVAELKAIATVLTERLNAVKSGEPLPATTVVNTSRELTKHDLPIGTLVRVTDASPQYWLGTEGIVEKHLRTKVVIRITKVNSWQIRDKVGKPLRTPPSCVAVVTVQEPEPVIAGMDDLSNWLGGADV